MTTYTPFSRRKTLWIEYRTSDGLRYARSFEIPKNIQMVAATGRKRMLPVGLTDDEAISLFNKEK